MNVDRARKVALFAGLRAIFDALTYYNQLQRNVVTRSFIGAKLWCLVHSPQCLVTLCSMFTPPAP